MPAYYNEIDGKKAAWLRELIARGLTAPGDVDERSIIDVQPADLAGYTQCHFFAGIGVWSYALRLAGWADTTRVWTGSCPCQPFSDAGKGEGADDPRHLWPAWFRLIRECRPDVLFGEQVASKDGRAWLDVVSADVEGVDYAIGPALLCAAGVGAPHIRRRLYFVAESREGGREELGAPRLHDYREPGHDAPRCGAAGGVGDTDGRGREARRILDGGASPEERPRRTTTGSSDARELGDAERARLEGQRGHGDDRDEPGRIGTDAPRPVAAAGASGELGDPASGGCGERGDASLAGRRGHTDRADLAGFWSDVDWIACTDGKARPVEPGTFPLVDGAPERVVRLRGYGDGIVAQVAEAFIRAYRDVRNLS